MQFAKGEPVRGAMQGRPGACITTKCWLSLAMASSTSTSLYFNYQLFCQAQGVNGTSVRASHARRALDADMSSIPADPERSIIRIRLFSNNETHFSYPGCTGIGTVTDYHFVSAIWRLSCFP